MRNEIATNAPRVKRFNGCVEAKCRWPNKTIPFKFDPKFNKDQLKQLEKSIHYIQNSTCLRFIERTTQKDFLKFVSHPSRTSSMVGRVGGAQELKLATGKDGKGLIRGQHHELMHTFGFHHMHKVPERDKYIRVIWENVRPDKKDKLKVLKLNLTDFGLGYDGLLRRQYLIDDRLFLIYIDS